MSDPPSSPQLLPTSSTLLSETVNHMKQQNEYQVKQLKKSDEVLLELKKATRRANILLVAAALLVSLGGLQQLQVSRFQNDLKQAKDRYALLEQTVDQKLSTTSASVVKKVEQLEQSSPKIVADDKGGLSLSLQVSPAPTSAVPVKAPVVSKKRIVTKAKAAAPAPEPTSAAPAPSSTGMNYVLVPLTAD